MLLRVSVTRDGKVIDKQLIDDGKDRREYWAQEYRSWAKEITRDLDARREKANG